MALKRLLINGFIALSLSAVFTGCGVFDSASETEEMYRIKNDKNNNGDGTFGGKSGTAEFGKTGDASATNPSDWGNHTQNPYDDFGTPIPGVKLPTVYFSFDRSMINSSEAPKLDEIASYLMSNPGTGVVIEGNCDDRGSDEYNRALGERRALASKEYLLNKGVNEARIRTISYGEERPASQNSDEASRAKNRRDDFVAVKLRK